MRIESRNGIRKKRARTNSQWPTNPSASMCVWRCLINTGKAPDNTYIYRAFISGDNSKNVSRCSGVAVRTSKSFGQIGTPNNGWWTDLPVPTRETEISDDETVTRLVVPAKKFLNLEIHLHGLKMGSDSLASDMDPGNKHKGRKGLAHIVSPPGTQLRSSSRSKQRFFSALGEGSRNRKVPSATGIVSLSWFP